MRYNPTPAEERMWEILKTQVMPKFPEHIFYRQQVKFGYILDFYCPTLRLALEVDGGIHNDQQLYDRQRERHLWRKQIDVRRVHNDAVFNKSEFVASELRKIIESKLKKPWYSFFLR